MNQSRPAWQRFPCVTALLCLLLGTTLPAQEFESQPAPDAQAILADPFQLSITPGVGQIKFHRRLFYRFMHADGLQPTPGVQKSTTIHRASASLGVDAGSTFSATYTLGWMSFSNEAFEDDLTHSAILSARRQFGNWRTALSHLFSRSSTPLIETGSQTEQTSNATTLRADRQIGQKTSLQLGAGQNIRSSDTFGDFVTWSSDNWLHYQLSPVVTTSAGYSYGYSQVDQSPDMSFHQVRGRVRWQPTQKIQMDLRAGVEKRSIVDSDLPDTETPIYGAAISYTPGEVTTITITGDRSVWPSYFRGQVTRMTQWHATLNQRLLGRFFLNLGYGHSISTYRRTIETTVTNREDTRDWYDAALTTTFAWGGSLSVTYERHENESTLTDFTVSRDMVGAEFSYSF